MNKLYIVSGPSGCGKTTVMRSVMNNEIVSFTTRAMREGEINGRDYIFLTNEEFEFLQSNDGLAEYTSYYGTANYGITMEELTTKLEQGDAFVIVDYIGKKQLEKLHPNTTSIFIFTSPEQAELRMIERGDNKDRVEQRMKTFKEELGNMKYYDYIISNNDGQLDSTIETVRRIVNGLF